MKTYKCRTCGEEGFSSPGKVARHKREAGHSPTRNGTGERRAPARASRKRSGSDGEGSVLQVCVDAFEGSRIDDGGRRRILNYLCDRFLPDEPAAEDAA